MKHISSLWKADWKTTWVCWPQSCSQLEVPSWLSKNNQTKTNGLSRQITFLCRVARNIYYISREVFYFSLDFHSIFWQWKNALENCSPYIHWIMIKIACLFLKCLPNCISEWKISFLIPPFWKTGQYNVTSCPCYIYVHSCLRSPLN